MPEQHEPKVPDSAVRDRLALDRTHLANERTLLAYIRTALALAGGGAALLAFVSGGTAMAAAWGLIAAAVVMLGMGAYRFVLVARRLGRGQ